MQFRKQAYQPNRTKVNVHASEKNGQSKRKGETP
jgi:hypothetical protein